MSAEKPIRVAMLVVDGNDVAGDQFRSLQHSSPSVHPAIQGLLNGLAEQEGLECHVLYGSLNASREETRKVGNVYYSSVPYRRLPLPGMGYVGRLWALLRKVKQLKPDLVHGQGTERESALAAVLSGFPSVITLHGNFREISKIMARGLLDYYRVSAWMESWVLKRVGGIICISNYVKQITNDFPAQKFLVPNAVLGSYLYLQRPEAPDKARVLCLGTIDPRKQTHLILEACGYLWEKGLDFECHVYGAGGYDGDYTKHFFEKLTLWEKRGKAFYHGMIKDPGHAIASAQVMVSASKEESFGMNVLEAMAIGTPVIAPPTGGIKDIIEEGVSGLYYREGDATDCALKIQRLLENRDLWKELSQNGRIRAERLFSAKKVAAQTLKVYEEMLSTESR